MFNKLKGFRTFITCGLIFIAGGAVDLQNSCLQNPLELGDAICDFVKNEWTGKIIMGLSGVAAWFRKQANK